MYKSGIYLRVNKITGKVYIGQANDEEGKTFIISMDIMEVFIWIEQE